MKSLGDHIEPKISNLKKRRIKKTTFLERVNNVNLKKENFKTSLQILSLAGPLEVCGMPDPIDTHTLNHT